MEVTKYCPKCHTRKSGSEFYKSKTTSDGLAGYCKECNKKVVRAYILAHPERAKRYRTNANSKYIALIDSDDTIVGVAPLSAQSGEFTKTCTIYCNMPGGYQVALLVDYIYHGNGYIIGTNGTTVYYEKVTSLEGKTRVNLTRGVSLGSYDGYKVIDITYADNYFYFILFRQKNQ